MNQCSVITIIVLMLQFVPVVQANVTNEAGQTRTDIITNPGLNATYYDEYGPFTNFTEAQLWAVKPPLRPIGAEPITGAVARMLQWQNAIEKLNSAYIFKMPIAFYGIVQDYASNPIAHATVELEWTCPSEYSGTSMRTIMTDENGTFMLTNLTGSEFSVMVSKQGYTSGSESMKDFTYYGVLNSEFHVPNSSTPVIFKLLRRAEEVNLTIMGMHAEKIPPNWPPVWFDVYKYQLSTNHGQFGFSIFVADTNIYQTYTQLVYRVNVTAGSGGGLKLSEGEGVMYEAPEAGYADSIMIEETPGVDYEATKELKFFFRTADTNYGSCKANVSYRSSRGAGTAIFRVSFNPNGSRNLTPKMKE